jgi:hypothetical protein
MGRGSPYLFTWASISLSFMKSKGPLGIGNSLPLETILSQLNPVRTFKHFSNI